jgi:hypothetical protein
VGGCSTPGLPDLLCTGTPELLRTVDLVVTPGREAHVEVPDDTELRNRDTDEPSERGIDGIERMRLVRDGITARELLGLSDWRTCGSRPCA